MLSFDLLCRFRGCSSWLQKIRNGIEDSRVATILTPCFRLFVCTVPGASSSASSSWRLELSRVSDGAPVFSSVILSVKRLGKLSSHFFVEEKT